MQCSAIFKAADTLKKRKCIHKKGWYFSSRTKSVNIRPSSIYSSAWTYLTVDVSFINEAPKAVTYALCDRGTPEAAELFTGPIFFYGSKELSYLPCKFFPSATACCRHIFCNIIIIIIITVMNKT
jgi:hypothetical protein